MQCEHQAKTTKNSVERRPIGLLNITSKGLNDERKGKYSFNARLFVFSERKQEQQAKTKKSIMASLLGTKKPDDDRELERSEMNHLELIKHKSAKIRQLIREFDDFYEKWMEKLKETAGGEDWGKFGKLTDKNESFLMVTYNGNQP